MISSLQYPIFHTVLARLTSVFLTFIFLFTTAKPQNVALSVPEATSETVTVAFQNNTGRLIAPQQRWMLARKTQAGYEALPFAEDFPGWPEIAESCPPTGGGTRTIDAERCFGRPLRQGEYRFTFYYVCATAIGRVGGEMQHVSVTFTIPAN